MFKTAMSALSLIEMLVVLSITGIMLSWAMVSFSPLISRLSTNADVDQFVALIALARHTAINQGVNVTVCPVHHTASDRCGQRNHWHLGTLVFRDLNGNRKVDGKDSVIRRFPALQHTTASWRAFRNRSYLQFKPTGITAWQNGSFYFCPAENPQPQHARRLTLNYAGRVYRSEDRDGDGIHEDTRGNPLSCS